MRVERRDLVNFSERKLHFLRERSEMRGREIAVAVLNEMQVLDQKIALARAVAQECLHLGKSARIDLPAFRCLGRSASPARGLVVNGSRDFTQNSPTILPSGLTSMESAAGTLGRPGIVMMSPQIATTNSVPAESLTSRTGIM